ncbi:MAG: DUF2157 domain-containing protein [Myxococcales bacterium]|nr:DUF2157 domain-containing protein [Myxococcales bacterium]
MSRVAGKDADDPLAARASVERLAVLRAGRLLDDDTFEASLLAASATPSKEQWARFLATLLLLVGAALVLSGAIYFVAFNWDDLGRFAKLAFTGGWVLVGLAIAWWRGAQPVGQVGLLGACVGVGALLAVVGQTYQTGADSWELFANWAVLILPWVVAGRMGGLWMLWLAVVNAAIWFFGAQVRPEWSWWSWVLLGAVNGLAWAVWLWAEERVDWVRGQWLPRVWVAVALSWLVLPAAATALQVPDGESGGVAATLLLAAGAAATLALALRSSAADRFPLTAATAAVLVVVDTWIGRFLLDTLDLDELGLLVLSGIVLGQAVAFVAWLTRLGPSDEERGVTP